VLFRSSHTAEIEATTIDMRHNDDEFSFVAHLLLNYFRWSDDASSSVDTGCHTTSVFIDMLDAIYQSATGEKFYNADQQQRPRPPYLTDKILQDFQAALKHRLKYMPFQPSIKETEVTALTREVSRALCMHGMPFIGEVLPPTTTQTKTEPKADGTQEVNAPERMRHQKQTQQRRHFFPEDDTPTSSSQILNDEMGCPASQRHEGARQHFFPDNMPTQDNNAHAETGIVDAVNYTMNEDTPFEFSEDVSPYRFDPSSHIQVDVLQGNEDVIFEVVDEMQQSLSYDEMLAAESEYYEDVNTNILDISGSVNGKKFTADMRPDRSFETETVVFREIPNSHQVRSTNHFLDGTGIQELQDGRQRHGPQTESANLDAMQKPRTAISDMNTTHQQIKRVTRMMHLTSNERVKIECRDRIRKLQSELNEILDIQNEKVLPTRLAPIRKVPAINDKVTEFKGDNKISATPSSAQGMDVMAPMDLPGNYQFQAQTEDHTFRATVPQGGVRKGEVFRSTLLEDEVTTKFTVNTSYRMGRWNDGLLDCCKFGPLHASVLNSLFCPILSLAQVMSRLKISWIGLPGRPHKAKDAFRISLILSMIFVIINCLLYYLPVQGVMFGAFSFLQIALFIVVDTLVLIYFLTNVARTRKRLRQRYMIPEQSCVGEEDTAITFACYPLVLMQMHRHTADYETFSAQCWSSNGLPFHVHVELPPSNNIRELKHD